MTSHPHRAAWHREDDNDRSRLAVLGGTREARVGCRAFERRCEKHRRDASQARDRLQDHRIARVLLRLVRMNLAICFRMQDHHTRLCTGTSITMSTFQITSSSQANYSRTAIALGLSSELHRSSSAPSQCCRIRRWTISAYSNASRWSNSSSMKHHRLTRRSSSWVFILMSVGTCLTPSDGSTCSISSSFWRKSPCSAIRNNVRLRATAVV